MAEAAVERPVRCPGVSGVRCQSPDPVDSPRSQPQTQEDARDESQSAARSPEGATKPAEPQTSQGSYALEDADETQPDVEEAETRYDPYPIF